MITRSSIAELVLSTTAITIQRLNQQLAGVKTARLASM
jgi:hypothetical protein